MCHRMSLGTLGVLGRPPRSKRQYDTQLARLDCSQVIMPLERCDLPLLAFVVLDLPRQRLVVVYPKFRGTQSNDVLLMAFTLMPRPL